MSRDSNWPRNTYLITTLVRPSEWSLCSLSNSYYLSEVFLKVNYNVNKLKLCSLYKNIILVTVVGSAMPLWVWSHEENA